jgi:hypothetical protein
VLHQRHSTQEGFTTVNTLARAVPRTIGVDVTDVDVQGTDVIESIHAAAGFVEFPTEVEDMCGGVNDDIPNYEFTNLADLEWELFIEGLGNDYPSTATVDVPAPIRTLFVAHAKKADSAIAAFRHELMI